MKTFSNYIDQQILTKDKEIAEGVFFVEGVTVRITNGYLNNDVDEDGYVLPAIETEDNSHIEYWENGKLHRDSLPAVIDIVDHYQEYWKNGVLIKREVI